MKLSIIIPAFNAETTICRCLDSVLKQTIQDYEVLVINDGSLDGTELVLKEYSDRYTDRLYYYSIENGGQGRARNIGIDRARGEYIGFVDSDDWIEPDMFEKLLTAAERKNADLVLCDVMAHYPDDSTAEEAIYRPNQKYAAAGFANNKLFAKELIKDIRFPEEKLWYEDTEFTAIAIHRANHIEHISETLYHYRRGLPSTMNNNNAQKNLDILTVMQHLEDELLPDEKDSFEFLVINHVLLDAMNRVQAMDAEEKRNVLWLMRAYVHEKIPILSASESYRHETRNRRIIMRLHYYGLSGVAEKILKIRNRRS